MHCINPITEALIENILRLQSNSLIDFSYDFEYMIAIGETGKGALYTTRLEELSPRNSLLKQSKQSSVTGNNLRQSSSVFANAQAVS